MSEQLVHTESIPPITIEPIEAAHERIKQSLHVVPLTQEQQTLAEADPSDTYSWVTYQGEKQHDGSYDWRFSFSEEDPEDMVRLNPVEHPEQTELFQSAVADVLDNETVLDAAARMEGRWWLNSIEADFIDKNIRQVVRVIEGKNSIDVVNCLDQALAKEHIDSIENVFNAVANYTGNKIFSRVKGIALLPGTEFEDNVAGHFQASRGVIVINMDQWGRNSDSDGLGKFKRFFPDGQVNFFELILAHEMGHAMDIIDMDEVEKHQIDKDKFAWMSFGGFTSGFSAFDDQFGWSHEVINSDPSNPFSSKNVHRLDEAAEIEWREDAPTGYATEHPTEDFAESFAIIALGGETSKLQSRAKVIGETVIKASGVAEIGPKRVHAEVVDPEHIFVPLTEIGLVARVPKSELPAA
jgi:hypothetical protein